MHIMAETVEIPLTICQSMVINGDYGDYTNQKLCDYAKVAMREVMVVMKYSLLAYCYHLVINR